MANNMKFSDNGGLDFTFFTYLLQFYKRNQHKIKNQYQHISRKFLDYNEDGFLRTPQFEALEIYVFLKEFMNNAPVHRIFEQWYSEEGKFVNFDTSQYDMFSQFDERSFKQVYAAMKKNLAKYPNYIFALTMGTGKTILMGTCIFYEFLLADRFPNDKRFCHNAIIFAPDKTVLQSVIDDLFQFEISRVVPPEYANFISTNIKYHFLTEAGTTLSTLDKSMFNIIISNTQKIILKKQHKQKTATECLFYMDKQMIRAKTSVYDELEKLYDFDSTQSPENEKELIANQRFEKIIRLNQLGIYIDEAHHAFGRTMERELKSLRITVNEIAARTSVVGCYNFTGTPYINNKVLPEVVYAYGLKAAIDNKFLKEVELNTYKNVQSEEFLHQIITHFWKHHHNKRYEGVLPKLAIFASQIDELQCEVKPAVEKILAKLNIPLGKILVNVGDLKYTTNDDIREFNKLDTSKSEKQFILLVNKGREGWNCRSLFGCALYRKPKSRIFVLQATMRCLRSIGDVQEIGRVYLSEENYEILDNELKQNFRVTAEEINRKNDTIRVNVHVKKPPVKFQLKRIKHKYDLKEKNPNSRIRFDFNTLDFEGYKSTVTTHHGMTPEATKEIRDITDSIEKYHYSSYMLVAEISRYLNKPCLQIEEILDQSYEGIEQILKYVNKYNQILYEIIIPRLFNYFYDIVDKITTEEEEVELVNPPESGFFPRHVKKRLLVVDNEPSIRQFVQKSFHLDNYCFDSGTEKNFFLDLLKRGNVNKLYFTGMLTHGESDFFISYIDPNSHTVRKYFPDFLMQNNDGTWTMIEIKGDYMIDDAVTAAKEKYALEMGFVNQMEYRLMEASVVGNGQVVS